MSISSRLPSTLAHIIEAAIVVLATWHIYYLIILSTLGTHAALVRLTPVFVAVCLVATFLLLVSAAKRTPGADATLRKVGAYEAVVLVAALLFAALVTLAAYRPDADDEYYLSMVVILLDNPAIEFAALPGGIWETHYKFVSYYPGVAVFSDVLDLPVLSVYYFIFPVVMAVLAVIAFYVIVSELAYPLVAFALIFFCIVMVTWGDVHRTSPNFGFVRMFQGKADYVTFIAPVIFHYSLKALCASGPRNWLLLAAALIAGAGLTQSAVGAGPLTFALVVLAISPRLLHERKQAFMAIGLLTLAAVTLVSIGDFGYEPETPDRLVTTRQALGLVFGGGPRGVAVLLTLLAFPFFLPPGLVRRAVIGFSVSALVLLFNPWTGDVLSRTFPSSSAWRVYWSVPVVIAVCVVAAGLTESVRRRLGMPTATVFFVAMATAFAAMPGKWVLSEANHSELSWPQPKLPDQTAVHLRQYFETYPIVDGRICVSHPEGCY